MVRIFLQWLKICHSGTHWPILIIFRSASDFCLIFFYNWCVVVTLICLVVTHLEVYFFSGRNTCGLLNGRKFNPAPAFSESGHEINSGSVKPILWCNLFWSCLGIIRPSDMNCERGAKTWQCFYFTCWEGWQRSKLFYQLNLVFFKIFGGQKSFLWSHW